MWSISKKSRSVPLDLKHCSGSHRTPVRTVQNTCRRYEIRQAITDDPISHSLCCPARQKKVCTCPFQDVEYSVMYEYGHTSCSCRRSHGSAGWNTIDHRAQWEGHRGDWRGRKRPQAARGGNENARRRVRGRHLHAQSERHRGQRTAAQDATREQDRAPDHVLRTGPGRSRLQGGSTRLRPEGQQSSGYHPRHQRRVQRTLLSQSRTLRIHYKENGP